MLISPSTAAHLRGSAMYFCLFMAYGCTDPFMPLIWRSKGLSEHQIGLLGAVAPVASFMVTPIACAYADKHGIQQKMLYVALLLYTITRPSVLMAGSFLAVVLAEVSYAIARSPVICLIDTAVRENSGTDGFGAQRLWGAVGYGITVLIGGIVCDSDGGDYGGVMAVFVTVMIGAIVASTRISVGKHCKLENKIGDIFPTDIGASSMSIKPAIAEKHGGTSEASSLTSATAIYYDALNREHSIEHIILENGKAKASEDEGRPQGDKENVIFSILSLALGTLENASFFSAIVLSGVAVGVIDTFLFIRLEELGGTNFLCGLARGVMCITEIPFFYFSGNVMRVIGVQGVMIVAQTAYLVRLLYYSVLENPWWVLPVEGLHGLTFAAMWTASLEHAHNIAPEHLRGTMRGLVAGLHWGFGFGLGAVLGGILYSELGPCLCFRVSAMLPPGSLFLLALPAVRSWFTKWGEIRNINDELTDTFSYMEHCNGCEFNHLKDDIICGNHPSDSTRNNESDVGQICMTIKEGGKNLPLQQHLPPQPL